MLLFNLISCFSLSLSLSLSPFSMHHAITPGKNSLLCVCSSQMNILRLFCVLVGVVLVVHLSISFGIKALKSGIKGKAINDGKSKTISLHALHDKNRPKKL
jgi:hypothetical protein